MCRKRDKEIAWEVEEIKLSSDHVDPEDIDTDEAGSDLNNYKEGEVSLENSRTSIKDVHDEAFNNAYDFETDELVRRESILLFSSVAAQAKFTLEDFEIKSILGKGTFGKVYLTQLKPTGQMYAIKTMRKDVLIETDQIDATKLERDILLNCNHQFLVGMDYVFQNDLRLYFVMPFVKGGELYTHFLKNKRFPEEVVKFYATQMVMAIGYLHEKNIIHRDLKLENILIDEEGYLKIIDFGLAKILKDEEEAMTFWGTPEYIAPEVIGRKGHDKAVDWWALGVIIYEMLIGVTPFYNKNRNMMLSKIQFAKIIFPDKKRYKIEYSDEVQNLICQLLVKKKEKRLGSINDAEEVLEHQWFKDVDTKSILNKDITPPFTPVLKDDSDTKYYKIGRSGISMADTIIPAGKIEEIKTYDEQFENFERAPKRKM